MLQFKFKNMMKEIQEMLLQAKEDYESKSAKASKIIGAIQCSQQAAYVAWIESQLPLIGTKWNSRNHLEEMVYEECADVADYESILQEWSDWQYVSSLCDAQYFGDIEGMNFYDIEDLTDGAGEPLEDWQKRVILAVCCGFHTAAELPTVQTLEQFRAKRNGYSEA